GARLRLIDGLSLRRPGRRCRRPSRQSRHGLNAASQATPRASLFHQRPELGDLLAAELVPLAATDPLEQPLDERRELERVEGLRHVVDAADVEPARAVAE